MRIFTKALLQIPLKMDDRKIKHPLASFFYYMGLEVLNNHFPLSAYKWIIEWKFSSNVSVRKKIINYPISDWIFRLKKNVRSLTFKVCSSFLSLFRSEVPQWTRLSLTHSLPRGCIFIIILYNKDRRTFLQIKALFY